MCIYCMFGISFVSTTSKPVVSDSVCRMSIDEQNTRLLLSFNVIPTTAMYLFRYHHNSIGGRII